MSVSTGGLKDALRIATVGEAGAHLGVWGSPEVVGGPFPTAGILEHDLAPDSWVSLKGTESS